MTREETVKVIRRREALLGVIADSYRRMATNTSMLYRQDQMAKCDTWLKELTELNRTDPVLFNTTLEQLPL